MMKDRRWRGEWSMAFSETARWMEMFSVYVSSFLVSFNRILL